MRDLCNRTDKSCVNRRNNAGQTALHIAAAGGHFKTVKVLLEFKADVSEFFNISARALNDDMGRVTFWSRGLICH